VQGWAFQRAGWRDVLEWQRLDPALFSSSDLELERARGSAAHVSRVEGGDTPLHAAVQAGDVDGVARLLEQGADVNARRAGGITGLTPLEYGLQCCSTTDVDSMARIARLLMDAGAARTPKACAFTRRLGERFEFSRDNIGAQLLKRVEGGLATLYGLLDVAPVPRRQMHDGKAPIAVRAVARRAQYHELWSLLVPASGPAATVQGEVIRIAGRLLRELDRNGGFNWDRGFEAMARALCGHLRRRTPLAPAELEACEAVTDLLMRSQGREGQVHGLPALAVAWVLANPEPMALPKPEYSF
jgi:hypothetical protein